MTQDQKDEFRKELYSSLRTEALSQVASIWRLEIFAGGALAALYGWFAINKDKIGDSTWVWWFPFALTVLIGFRAILHYLRFQFITKYLHKMEEYFLKNEPVPSTWEEYIGKNPGLRIIFTFSSFGYWIALGIIAYLFHVR